MNIKSINNYSNKIYKTLPYNGWFKLCSNKSCEIVTSYYYILNYKNKQFKIYYCKKCLKNKNINLKTYSIKNYLNYLDN